MLGKNERLTPHSFRAAISCWPWTTTAAAASSARDRRTNIVGVCVVVEGVEKKKTQAGSQLLTAAEKRRVASSRKKRRRSLEVKTDKMSQVPDSTSMFWRVRGTNFLLWHDQAHCPAGDRFEVMNGNVRFVLSDFGCLLECREALCRQVGSLHFALDVELRMESHASRNYKCDFKVW